MPINVAKSRELLKSFDFRRLFVEELGWDRHDAKLTMQVDGHTFSLEGYAQKRGMAAYTCTPAPANGRLPEYALRRKVERQVAKSAHEHIIIFLDGDKTTQIWQWVRREPGKPAACREHAIYPGHSGDALLQKLSALAFTLDEEEKLTLTDVTGRARKAFDVERVTKRFYERFKTEHAAFLKFIEGIESVADRQWYASIMLNRLMFVYFIQRKRFLDGDPDYLRNRLQRVQQQRGKDKFLSFYRYFLIRLMHEGLGRSKEQRKLDQTFAALLGNVPYLNGGIFEQHQLELANPGIDIPDKAFEAIFDFFDEYQWHLDERPLRDDREINPDVLGYIFEKYINQKQMGAYYTKEDITEYIAKNTVLPFIFDKARNDHKHGCPVAFKPDSALWRLLRDDPDRYIYPAVRQGVIDEQGNVIPLPAEIEAGIADVAKRAGWNKPAAAPFALPTETWREHVARRQRCLELRRKLAAGEVGTSGGINDLITLNLDIRQFAQDVIENCEGPELLRALYHAISTVTVLDPTCGSGAFLFAALNILEPLYEACLDRMDRFIADADVLCKAGDGIAGRGNPGDAIAGYPPTKKQLAAYDDFRRILAEVATHQPGNSGGERYFIFKSIILSNLFGVDIMEEAVEICRLRLFLKLVAQVEPDPAKPNLGVEPLPDIDFNIRAGNTLVGFASIEAVRQSQEGKLAFAEGEIREIERDAEAVDRMFGVFRRQQTAVKPDSQQLAVSKQGLRQSMRKLADRLDRYLAGQYGIDAPIPSPISGGGRGQGEGGSKGKKASSEEKFQHWRSTHQPFHWITEFYGIMSQGGFDAIIGNPPWVEYAKVKNAYTVRGYTTEKCGNLHTLCSERSLSIRSSSGSFCFIVQLPLTNSSRMDSARELLRQSSADLYVLPFDDRPGKLFEGLQHCRSVIFISRGSRLSETGQRFVTRYQRWPTETRSTLFQRFEFTSLKEPLIFAGHFPKLDTDVERSVFAKVQTRGVRRVGEMLSPRATKSFVFYQEATQYWVKAVVGLPYYSKNGKVGEPAHGRSLWSRDPNTCNVLTALLNSSLFYAYFIAYGDCFHLSDTLATHFPITDDLMRDPRLVLLGRTLDQELRANAERKTINTKDGHKITYGEFFAGRSKPIIDEIDAVLAEHYGFTAEELDFIINYDIKYRLGADAGSDPESDAVDANNDASR